MISNPSLFFGGFSSCGHRCQITCATNDKRCMMYIPHYLSCCHVNRAAQLVPSPESDFVQVSIQSPGCLSQVVDRPPLVKSKPDVDKDVNGAENKPRTVRPKYGLLLKRDRLIILRHTFVRAEAKELRVSRRYTMNDVPVCNPNDNSLFGAFSPCHLLAFPLDLFPCFLLCALFSCCYPRYDVVERIVDYSNAPYFRRTVSKSHEYRVESGRGATDYTGR